MNVILAEFTFWNLVWLLLVFLPLLFLWVFALAHLFKQIGTDSGISIALWLVAIIIFPILGALIYLGTRSGEGKRDGALDTEHTDTRDHYTQTLG